MSPAGLGSLDQDRGGRSVCFQLSGPQQSPAFLEFALGVLEAGVATAIKATSVCTEGGLFFWCVLAVGGGIDYKGPSGMCWRRIIPDSPMHTH